MCEAIEGMIKDAEKKARISTLLSTVKSLMETLHLSEQSALDAIQVSDKDRKKIVALLH